MAHGPLKRNRQILVVWRPINRRRFFRNKYLLTYKIQKNNNKTKLLLRNYLRASDSPATYGALQMCFDWLIDWNNTYHSYAYYVNRTWHATNVEDSVSLSDLPRVVAGGKPDYVALHFGHSVTVMFRLREAPPYCSSEDLLSSVCLLAIICDISGFGESMCSTECHSSLYHYAALPTGPYYMEWCRSSVPFGPGIRGFEC